MVKLPERVAVLEARYERVLSLEAKLDAQTVYVKCIAYLLAALITHVVGAPWANMLSGLLSAS